MLSAFPVALLAVSLVAHWLHTIAVLNFNAKVREKCHWAVMGRSLKRQHTKKHSCTTNEINESCETRVVFPMAIPLHFLPQHPGSQQCPLLDLLLHQQCHVIALCVCWCVFEGFCVKTMVVLQLQWSLPCHDWNLLHPRQSCDWGNHHLQVWQVQGHFFEALFCSFQSE